MSVKVFIAAVVCMAVCLSATATTAYAQDGEIVVEINSDYTKEDLWNDVRNGRFGDSTVTIQYESTNGISRANLCNCGGRITETSVRDEYRLTSITCPIAEFGYSDYLIEYRLYKVMKCNSCGKQYSKTLTSAASTWKVACLNGFAGYDYEYYTVKYPNGNNPHENVNPANYR